MRAVVTQGRVEAFNPAGRVCVGCGRAPKDAADAAAWGGISLAIYADEARETLTGGLCGPACIAVALRKVADAAAQKGGATS